MRHFGGGPLPEGRSIKKNTLRRAFTLFKPYKASVTFMIIAVIIASVITILPAWYIKIIVDNGLQERRMDVVTRYTIYTIIITILGSGLTIFYGYLSVTTGQAVMRDLRNKLYSHLQGMSLRFFTSTRTGEIQSRLISDVSGAQGVLTETITNTLSNFTAVFSSIAAMIYLDWRLALLSFSIVPVFALAGAKVGIYARSIRKGIQEQTAEVTSMMQETLSVSGALLIKTTGKKEKVLDKFDTENNLLSTRLVKGQMVQYYFFGLIRMIMSLTPAFVFWLAGWLMMKGDHNITIGMLLAFTGLQQRMFFPLTALMNVQVEVSSSIAILDRIYEYLDLEQDIQDTPNAIELPKKEANGKVEFRGVSFSYETEAETKTLDNISFTANPGQLIALVGPSGAGKTTLAYLIPRLYDVNEGQVLVDDMDVRDIKLESLSRIIGAVTQETYLIHADIRENLLFAKPTATEEEIITASKMAAIHDHISSLPEGYATVVGERGYKLSGGEKQRLAIARAILKNPKILILDEATSALDTTSERLVQSGLNRLMEGRTTFAIAHRLSTILAADKILVIDKGKIVESGKHEELLKLDGLYAQLYQQQFWTESPVL